MIIVALACHHENEQLQHICYKVYTRKTVSKTMNFVCAVCRGECAILLDDANLLSLKLFRTPPDVGAVAEHQALLLRLIATTINYYTYCLQHVLAMSTVSAVRCCMNL
jgi:hypothetical protein